MPAIPSQEILDAVRCCDWNMECIGGGLLGQGTISEQPGGKGLRVGTHFQERHIRQNTKAICCIGGIASSTLRHDESGHIDGKAMPALNPPFVGRLLVGGDTENPARPHGEVADDRRLEIHGRIH